MSSKSIKIMSWNMRSLTSASHYINDVVLKNDIDVICLAEHRLYECELHKLGLINTMFKFHGKSSRDLASHDQNVKRGHCGVAILWKSGIMHRVKTVVCPSDRICGIEILNVVNGGSLFILNVYLPQQGCKIAKYTDEIKILDEVINICRVSGEVIVIGDTNAHFGEEVGERFWGKTTPNAKVMLKCVKDNEMIVLDANHNHCSGPAYTFAVENVGSSYVDHCIISQMLLNNNIQIEVLPDCVLNTSDHLAMLCSLELTHEMENCNIKDTGDYIAWHKLNPNDITELYTKPLEESCKLIIEKADFIIERLCKENVNQVSHYVEDLICDVKSSINVAKTNLPKSQFSKSLKPYWSKHLSWLCKQKKGLWIKWLNEGQSRNDVLFKEYKEAKAEFRRIQREAMREYEMNKMKEIVKSQEIDQRHFWYIVNKNKRKSNSVHPIKTSCNKTLIDPDEIREEWKQYFQVLYTPKDESCYDKEFKNHVKTSLEEMFKESQNNIADDVLTIPITVKEVESVIKGLKSRKAPGYDLLTTECFKYGGIKFKESLTKLFNIICKMEYVSKQFKHGIIVPVPKGNKDMCDKDNYRGITLLPVIGKIFEKCILQRVEKWAKENNVINEQQGAAQERCSSMHVSWLVREVIAKHNENGINVYVGMLDQKKAYDTVWQDGLFYILYKAGLKGKAWRLMQQFYNGFICYVKIGGKLSHGFEALQGIHQGAPCSMFMFEVFTSKLLEQLAKCYFSLNLYGLNICSPAYADDLTIMSLSKEGLQTMLSLVFKYSVKWRFEFNATKCSIMVFGNKKEDISDSKFMLGKIRVKSSNSEVLLGTPLSNCPKHENFHFDKRIVLCRNMLYVTQSIGSNVVPITPVTASKLYWGACIPKLLYGMDIMDVSDDTMINMEKFHFSAAKHCQGLPNNTANFGAIETVGWHTLSAQCDLIRLLFMWRVLTLPANCLYKKLIVSRILEILFKPGKSYLGPTKMFVSTCKKYGLVNVLKKALITGDFMSMKKWKTRIKELVNKRDRKRILIGCSLYKVLDYLVFKTRVLSMSIWWHHAFRNPQFARINRSVVRLLLNVECYGFKTCDNCQNSCINSSEHLLFECEKYNDIRIACWAKVIQSCPLQLANDMSAMSARDCCIFILNGFYSPYTQEWNSLYCNVSMFLFNMLNID